MTRRERFAPSPTGPLHLGHAFSALTAFDAARAAHGEFLLRIEDIDRARSKPVWEEQIYDDLRWLGITWATPPMRQSDRMPAYQSALRSLWDIGLLYPCTCNRRDIHAAATAPQEGGEPLTGPDGVIYPGTCRTTPDAPMPADVALRLNIGKATERVGKVSFTETGTRAGTHEFARDHFVQNIGDVVLSRRDMGTSYHLSVVVDDAHQGITNLTRGEDLFDATAIHVLLQRLLDLPTPIYHHHRLIRDENGKRLAKRHDAMAIAEYRKNGATPAQIRDMLGL